MTCGATVQSNRLLTRLTTFFGWAVRQDLLATNPAARVRPVAKENSRDRVLTDDEIIRLWAGCDRLVRAPYYGALIKLLLLTAARRSEVSEMQWSEINERTWTIAGARSKNGKPQ